MRTKGRLSFVATLTLLLVAGCGKGKKGEVSGEITTSDGRKVTAGTIAFHTEAGIIQRPIAADGTYSVSQLPLGEVEVTIETESANTNSRKKKPADYGGGGSRQFKPSPMPEGAPQAEKGEYVPIDPKHADKKTSGLKCTVSGGKQTQNFTVNPPAAPKRKK